MAEDLTYTTKVYERVSDGDGRIVSGMTVGASGAMVIESGGVLRGTDSASFSCMSDFQFFIREQGIYTKYIKNYMIGRNQWSILILSGTTLSAGAPAGSQPPILPSRIGYFFISSVKNANNHQLSARLCSAYQGAEMVIHLRGAGESTVLILHASADTSALNLSGVSVIGQSYGSSLSSIILYTSGASAAFLRLVGVADGTWAVIDAGQSRGDGGCVVEQGMS